MEWIEIKCKKDVKPIIEEYKEYRVGIKEELEELKDDDSNHAMYRRMHLGTRNFNRNKVSGFFNSKKVDALLDKGFSLKYNGIMLVIDTNNYNWGVFNYYPQSNKMYAKKWKKWYTYSWSWIEKQLINNESI